MRLHQYDIYRRLPHAATLLHIGVALGHGGAWPRRFCAVGAKSETATMSLEFAIDITVLGHLYLPIRTKALRYQLTYLG